MFLLQLEAARLLLRGLGLGLLSALLALGLSASGALAPLERGSSNALFRLRGPRAPKSKIVLLVIDEATAIRAGRMPLPRRFYTQTIQRLRAKRARVIAFDLVFSIASDDPKQDALLAGQVAAGRDVTQGIIFDSNSAAIDPNVLRRLPGFAIADRGGGARLARSITAPVAAMLPPTAALGHLNFRPEPGGEVRRIPHLIRFGDHLYPSLALSAAIETRGQTITDWVAAPGKIYSLGDANEIPVDQNAESLVNWLGGDGTFPTYSLIELFDGRIPRGTLPGATVMIGNARSGSFLPLTTPFTAPVFNNQSALHLQANAFDDIVSNRVLRPLPGGFAWLILGVFSLGAGALLARQGALGALISMVLSSLVLWAIAVLSLHFNHFVSLATPQIALILTGATCLGVRQRRESRELRLMHELFDGYVGDEVLRLIKTNKPKLDGELRHVAILFCDIRGFSGLSESLRDDPERLLRLLNDHFEPIIDSLKIHGAYVDNFAGDLIMAVFGAPVSEQGADRNTRSAVLAALDILHITARRNVERDKSGERRIDIGVGVHCGLAVVGDLGTKRAKHYTAIGDTVNIASRVEGETRNYSTGFLVTEEVVRACVDHPDTSHLKWQFVAETAVKGRQSIIKLFQPEN